MKENIIQIIDTILYQIYETFLCFWKQPLYPHIIDSIENGRKYLRYVNDRNRQQWQLVNILSEL